MARAKPTDEQPDRTKMVQLIDLEKHYSNLDGSLVRNHHEVDRGEACYFASPMDFPAYIRFIRTVASSKEGTLTTIDHLSSTIEIDLFTASLKVFVKHDRKKKQFVLMVQEGTEKAQIIAKYPTV